MQALSPAVHDAELDKRARNIITPEGIPIRFTLAPVGERIAALLFDLLIQIGVLFALGLLLTLATGGRPSWLTAVIIILSFFIANMYFVFFEVRWQGATPGRRRGGFRVSEARGGRIGTWAGFAGNLVRELELWMPVRLLLGNRAVWPDAPGWALVLATVWTLVFLLLPLFNKDKLRVGDLIGGTRVVMQPKPVLLPDLAHQPASALPDQPRAPAAHVFTEAQLGVYGIYELQVLEGVLRQDPLGHGQAQAVAAVTEKVRAKIDYAGAVLDPDQFLRDFYVALRGHLEQKMLFGKKRRDKFEKK